MLPLDPEMMNPQQPRTLERAPAVLDDARRGSRLAEVKSNVRLGDQRVVVLHVEGAVRPSRDGIPQLRPRPLGLIRGEAIHVAVAGTKAGFGKKVIPIPRVS